MKSSTFPVRIAAILFFLYVGNIPVIGQSTDMIKFYILYDVSNSVPLVDRKQNLNTMLNELIQKTLDLKDPYLKSRVVFDFIPFGTDSKINQKIIAYSENEMSAGALQQNKVILNLINEQISKSSDNRSTDIYSALDILLKKIGNDQNDPITNWSSGVFLLTDGKLGERDYNSFGGKFPTLSVYLDTVNTIIEKIQKVANIPFFTIQTSPTPYSGIFRKYLDSIKPIRDKQEFYTNDHSFWITRTRKFNIDDRDSAYIAFQTFVDNTKDLIMDYQEGIRYDSVGVAIKVQEVVNVLNYLRILYREPDLLSLISRLGLSSDPIFIKLKPLLNYLEKANLSREDVYEINQMVDYYTKRSNELETFMKSLQKPALKNLSLTEAPKILESLRLRESYRPVDFTDVKKVVQVEGLNNLNKNLINGLADYMIERTKQEAIYAFLDNVNESVISRAKEVEKYVFPYTVNKISDPRNYPDLTILREALYRDLRNIPNNIIQYPQFYRSEALISLAYYYKFYDGLTRYGSLEQAVKAIVDHRIQLPKSITLQNSRNVEQALYFTARLIDFLSLHDLTSLYKDNDTEQIKALSTLAVAIAIGDRADYDSIDVSKAVDIVRHVYSEYSLVTKQIEALHKLLENHTNQLDYDGYKRYKAEVVNDILWRSAELLLSGFEILETLSIGQKNPYTLSAFQTKERVEQLTRLSRDCIESYFLIQQEKYPQAVLILAPHVVKAIYPILTRELRDDLIKKRYNRERIQFDITKINSFLDSLYKDSARTNLKAVLTKPYPSKDLLEEELNKLFLSDLIPLIKHSSDKFELDKELLKKLSDKLNEAVKEPIQFADNFFKSTDNIAVDALVNEFGTLYEYNDKLSRLIVVAGEISAASSAEDIKKILSKYALPVASYKLKRECRNTFMINAYVGIGSGFDNIFRSIGVTPALFAPVGAEYSWRWKRKFAQSFSLFLNVMDIGNVINYRLTNKNDENRNVINFENILSPGLFAVFGIVRKVPLSTGIGYQANPGRLTVFAAFDLPLFNFAKRY